jgi:hypothetical protein
MSEIKKFSFAERVRLNDDMTSLVETPYIRWRTTADVAEPRLVDLPIEGRLQEQEMDLLNRFADPTLSDLAYQTIAEELIAIVQERVAAPAGTTNIAKGDFVQLRGGEIAKVQNIVTGIVQVKRKSGQTKKIRVTRLSRIGKHQGKPAFGFLSPKQD